MSSKNQELKTLISRYRKNPQQNINPLSMALNGVIDAAVMGGIQNYTKASIVLSSNQFPLQELCQFTVAKNVFLRVSSKKRKKLRVSKKQEKDGKKYTFW